MHEAILTFLSIFFLSMFKFIAGPILGFAAGYGPWKIILVSVTGMMSSVTMFTYLGSEIKNWVKTRFGKSRKLFTAKNRRIIRIWTSYGEMGVAFLTPILLTPIGGTLILVSFGSAKQKIILYMLLSALAWATFFSFSIDWLLSLPLATSLFR